MAATADLALAATADLTLAATTTLTDTAVVATVLAAADLTATALATATLTPSPHVGMPSPPPPPPSPPPLRCAGRRRSGRHHPHRCNRCPRPRCTTLAAALDPASLATAAALGLGAVGRVRIPSPAVGRPRASTF